MRRVRLVVVALLCVLVVSCAAQSEQSSDQESAPAPSPAPSPSPPLQSAPQLQTDPPATDEDVRAAVGEAKQCQIDLAVADVGTEGVERLVGEWIEESLQTQIDPNQDFAGAIVDWAKPERPIGEFFAAKGYVC